MPWISFPLSWPDTASNRQSAKITGTKHEGSADLVCRPFVFPAFQTFRHPFRELFCTYAGTDRSILNNSLKLFTYQSLYLLTVS